MSTLFRVTVVFHQLELKTYIVCALSPHKFKVNVTESVGPETSVAK